MSDHDEDDIAENLFQQFIGEDTPSLVIPEDLGRALYFASENNLWPDWVDSVSAEQAVVCWRLIERLKTNTFPENLRM